MNDHLIRYAIDEDLFADLAPEPDSLAISARLLAPASDRRIPAPPSASLLLLAVFRLEEPAPPTDHHPAPGWHLSFDRIDTTNGLPTVRRLDLLPQPRDATFGQQMARRPPGPVMAGLIYRGAFWCDLSPLQLEGALHPGTQLTLAHGAAAKTSLIVR